MCETLKLQITYKWKNSQRSISKGNCVKIPFTKKLKNGDKEKSKKDRTKRKRDKREKIKKKKQKEHTKGIYKKNKKKCVRDAVTVTLFPFKEDVFRDLFAFFAVYRKGTTSFYKLQVSIRISPIFKVVSCD